MNTETFLAANSGTGFFSLYDEFPPEGAFLHIIKGGPGTGKSSFMRRLRQAAEERGLDTETVLCSGDPASLDALYIPALRQAWVDGTAPHSREPDVFGANSDYVNLGAFCRTPLNREDAEEARRLTAAYKARYTTAYSFLSAARAAESAYSASAKRSRADRVIELPETAEGEGKVRRCFVSAISCQGILYLRKTVNSLCKHIVQVEPQEMQSLLNMAAGRKVDIMQCLSPLSPDRTQMLILPQQGIAFAIPELVGKPLSGAAQQRSAKRYRREGDGIQEKLLSRAVKELAQAKELHDKLENIYRPYMDHDALTAYTENTVSELFADV